MLFKVIRDINEICINAKTYITINFPVIRPIIIKKSDKYPTIELISYVILAI